MVSDPRFLFDQIQNSSNMSNPNTVNAAGQLLLAASSASPINFQIPSVTIKLDRHNFSLWRNTVLTSLQAFDLEDSVLHYNPPSEFKPQAANVTTPPEPNPEFAVWHRRDRFVLLWFRSTLTERTLSLVVRATSVHEA